MTKIILSIIVIGILLATSMASVNAFVHNEEEQNIEMKKAIPIGEPFDGYILYTPWGGTKTYLINNASEVVHKWSSTHTVALPVYLLESGDLLRASYKSSLFHIGAGVTGRVEMFNWDGAKIWNFEYANSEHHMHHDIEPLPDGNILMIAWEKKTRDEAIAAGLNPGFSYPSIFPDHIVEVKPTGGNSGEIVWEWHVWDHLIQDFVDINYVNYKDFNHINSIDYNEELDQILISCRNFNEIWVIDHSTTTAEAAGHTGGNSGKGGDILYRWGNPQTYHRGSIDDQKLFWQHNARWIEEGCPGEGHITIFNNGYGRPSEDYSSVEEIIPPVDEDGDYYLEPEFAYGPEEPVWTYTAENPTDFYNYYLSGAQRLPSGNTLICDGAQGYFFEVTPEKETIWDYFNPFPLFVNDKNVFKIQYYPSDYPGIGELSINIENEQSNLNSQTTEEQSTPSGTQGNSSPTSR